MDKTIQVVEPYDLYKWSKNFKHIQDRFWNNKYKVRRLQQIEDFVKLNNFSKVYHIEETRLDLDIPKVTNIKDADLILVTHQGYSRYRCNTIIDQIRTWIDDCTNIYLCLNRHYININNDKIDMQLPNDYQQAITAWLSSSLGGCKVVDMSRDYIDHGLSFTWTLPDRHYFISK